MDNKTTDQIAVHFTECGHGAVLGRRDDEYERMCDGAKTSAKTTAVVRAYCPSCAQLIAFCKRRSIPRAKEVESNFG